MLRFQSKLETIYNDDELAAIRSKTARVYNWVVTEDSDYYGISLFPLYLYNKDKSLYTSQVQHNISEASATESNLHRICTDDTPNNHIRVALIKRGWTFAVEYMKKNDYTYLDKESLYIQTNANHKVRVFQKGNYTLVITNQTSDMFEHRLFSAIPLLYKTQFTWNEDLIDFFRTVDSHFNDPEPYTEAFVKIVKNSKVLDNLKQDKLVEALQNANQYVYKKYQEQIAILENSIKQYEGYLIEKYSELRETQALLAFNKSETDMTDVAKYIQQNPYIVDYFSLNNRYFILAIEAPLEYIDVKAFKQMLKNPKSYLYPTWSKDRGSYSILTKEHPLEFVEMLKDLFLSSKYKVYSRSEIVLDFQDKNVFPLRKNSSLLGRRPKTWDLANRRANNPERCIVPHMHIEYYDCWSGNKTNVSKALNSNNIIGAIDICVNTTKDINVNDSAVFGRFVKEELIKSQEFPTGYMDRNARRHDGMPGDEYKTIWDNEKKCFRTFLDIFMNDYIKEKAVQTDFDIDFSDYII